MQKVLLTILVIVSFNIYSNENSIYNDLKESVIYLEHEIYIDGNKSEFPELFKTIEERSEKKILNNFLTVKSGSGFIITEDGYALTNRHVISYTDLDLSKANIGYNFANSFLKDHGFDFTQSKKDKFIVDFINLVERGDYRFMATINNKEYKVEVIQITKEDEPDIGLIKLKSINNFKPIKLADSKDINDKIIGKDVISFGFPLGSTMDSIFEDRAVTMNRGNISALRNDNLSIQHNAAISSGNSGGPLVGKDKIVYGINTAEIIEGNSLYYSVDSGRVRTFLADNGYSDILKWNDRITTDNKNNLTYNLLGEIESSPALFIFTEEAADVYIDNKLIGKSPLYYTLENQVTDIRVENKNGTFEEKLRLVKSRTETTTLKPNFKTTVPEIAFESGNDDKIQVYADGMLLGSTPLKSSLKKGTYALSFISKNYIYEDKTIEVTKANEKIVIEGKPGFSVEIRGMKKYAIDPSKRNENIISGVSTKLNFKTYNFKNDTYDLTFNIGDKMILPSGDYSLTINGVYGFENKEIPLSITKNEVFNIKDIAGTGTLHIKGLPPNASVVSNGELYNSLKGNRIDLPLGLNNIYVWSNGHQPLEIDITVKPDNSAFITYEKELGHNKKSMIWGATAASLLGTGILLYTVSGYDDYAVRSSDDYDDYVEMKEDFTMFCSTLVFSGIIAIVPTIKEFLSYQKQRSYYNNLKESNNG